MVTGEVVHNDDGKIKTMAISTKWTLFNFILSIIGSIYGCHAITSFGVDNDGFGFSYLLNFFVLLLIFVPLTSCLGLMFISEKCCSSCCNINKTGVDINDFSKIIDLQTGREYGTNEDEEMATTETEAKTHQPSII